MKPVDQTHFYRDARRYDLMTQATAPNDIPFYSRQIEKYGGPVLELACGTGRITIPLAEQGIKITGLDISESMLTRAKMKAREKGIEIKWVNADCRKFKLNKKFNLIFIPYNTIAYIHDLASITSFFSSVKKHLKRNGVFVIDIYNPSFDFLTRDPNKRYPFTEYFDPDKNAKIIIMESNVYDAATQINRTSWSIKTGENPDEILEELNMRIYFPQELDSLLKLNGFEIEAKYGNYDETPFQSDSPKQIIICRKIK